MSTFSQGCKHKHVKSVLGIEVVQWVGLPLDDTAYTFHNITLSQGIPYAVSARAFNHVGLRNTLTSNFLQIDTIPPVAGTVYAGCDSHTQVKWSNGQNLTVSWYGFGDKESSLKMYEFAMGTNNISSDIIPFTDVGLSSNLPIPQQLLNHSQSYVFHVRATDNADNSIETKSDPVTVDKTAPLAVTCNKWYNILSVDLNETGSPEIKGDKMILPVSLPMAEHILYTL